MPKIVRTLYDVAYDAICHLIEDDGFAMASHVALSILLAVFPFLIFGTTLANFLGADQFSSTAVHLIFDTWPEAIAKPVADQVLQVLTIPRGGLLTVSVLAAAYFASNGVEALRISLNRAYRVQETRPWYFTRLASLGYVLIAVIIFAAISILLVAVPLALDYARQWFPLFADTLEIVFSWRIYGTLFVLTVGLLVVHLWLPAGRRRVYDVIPGVLLTLLFWLAGALIFAFYLATFANYTATYAGLASVMVVLIFLYMVGVIFIIGAEINAALMKFRVRAIFARNFLSGQGSKLSKTDKIPDIGRR
ncbi:YihY/virulence factor BrkB family protein [Rhizobium sp. SEMIA 4085]|uniref:Virulence factor BrkB family protein n=2 Tax=Rhizobium gallicum TaxID=56730 RepID=A0A0B4X8S5_9HYPH|nr:MULTISPECIES: YihY/virulence factor BrkB family protein [Rhizobium]TDW16513.1 membrane protein [Rhizobium azibense]AJD43008.1 virulence factor BrkB family protein [Rhizobium gallicum bv. gallicum R602sp]APO69412.1 virulence factor BrkB family protein [Rhizobium gallicum]NNH28181.1 YihY/virulence factor BrkB family protein [Rhizobium sp. SEMIA 4085]QPB19311.1 YihY/virulence factor BrkB family protein [Rhizobium sp. 007]